MINEQEKQELMIENMIKREKTLTSRELSLLVLIPI